MFHAAFLVFKDDSGYFGRSDYFQTPEEVDKWIQEQFERTPRELLQFIVRNDEKGDATEEEAISNVQSETQSLLASKGIKYGGWLKRALNEE